MNDYIRFAQSGPHLAPEANGGHLEDKQGA